MIESLQKKHVLKNGQYQYTLKSIVTNFKKTYPQSLSLRFKILHGALRTVISFRSQGPTISPITSVEAKKIS